MVETTDRLAAAAADWFARLQEDDASEQDFRQWQQWLKISPAHQRAFLEIEQAWRLIGDVRPVPWASIAELERERFSPARRWMAWGLAATILILAGTGIVWRHISSGESARYATVTAEQRSVRLEDGSRITLGARSRITPRVDPTTRRVALDYGEAFFEVAHDANRPFTVVARGSEIRALGTAFNVRAERDSILVSVAEGRVAISSSGEPQIVLSSGQQALLQANGAVEQQEKPPNEVATWREGRFEYRGEPLRQVVADLNRYTDRPIVLSDETAGALRYSGTVFPDHLDEWLQGIDGVLPVAVEDAGNEWRIVLAR